jgi:hypothetical protein
MRHGIHPRERSDEALLISSVPVGNLHPFRFQAREVGAVGPYQAPNGVASLQQAFE